MTPVSDPDIYHGTVRRTARLMAVIGVAGAIAGVVLKGPRFGLGLLLGAALSGLSFWRLTKIVESLGGPPKKRSIAPSVMRFLLLAGAAYAIVKYLEVTAAAVFIGLLASAAAVIAAIIYELIYGT